MTAWFEREWQRLGGGALIFFPLALLFRLAVFLRRLAYRTGLAKPWRAKVPVIVVGNISVGGTGKTPVTIAIVEMLKANGFTPGVVSRGYGSVPSTEQDPSGVVRVFPERATPEHFGDEPVVIARRCRVPVFISPDRPAAVRALLRTSPEIDVVVSDDGLQHYALGRDFSIAVFDERGTGNGRLLPAGPLREPMARTASLDAIVINGKPASPLPVSRLTLRMHLQAAPLYRLADPAEKLAVPDLIARHGARVAALAGIGSPARFFDTLRTLGFEPEPYAFPDHHTYTRADFAGIAAPLIVMTEKDAIKCAAYADLPIWVLPVAAMVDAALLDAILEKIRGPQTA